MRVGMGSSKIPRLGDRGRGELGFSPLELECNLIGGCACLRKGYSLVDTCVVRSPGVSFPIGGSSISIECAAGRYRTLKSFLLFNNFCTSKNAAWPVKFQAVESETYCTSSPRPSSPFWPLKMYNGPKATTCNALWRISWRHASGWHFRGISKSSYSFLTFRHIFPIKGQASFLLSMMGNFWNLAFNSTTLLSFLLFQFSKANQGSKSSQ